MKISYISCIFPKFKKAILVASWCIDSGLKAGRYVRNYSLQGKTLSLDFPRGNCHKVADPAGRCSLFLEEQKIYLTIKSMRRLIQNIART